MQIRLDGQVAIITGGSRGIGAAIARVFDGAGARMAIADQIPPEEAEDDFVRTVATSTQHRYIVTDVSDEESVQAMVAEVMDVFGRIDILVNNAGILSGGNIVDTSVAEWDRMMAVNLRSVFLCCRAVLPHMLTRRSGRIINMASQLAYSGQAATAAYAASKGGIMSFTRSLAREVVRDGILVNSVAPGPIETPLVRDTTPEDRAATNARLPIGRVGRPEEVAPTVLFLASAAASYYVGQVLGPNGGDVMP